jgi:histidine triad (HIT) family protein
MDCLFCRIVKNEVPAFVVYEDDIVMAFLDIAPVNQGHVLVIPKIHYSNYEEMDDVTLSKIFMVVKKIGYAIKKGLNVSGYNTIVNNDPVAGQIIPHFHVHIIPRNRDDGLGLWPQGKYGTNEAETVLNKIKNSIL